MAHPNQTGERGWSVQSAGTAGSSAAVTNTTHHELDGRHIRQIMVYTATQIYFNFDNATTDVSAANDMIIEKNTLTVLNVPHAVVGNNLVTDKLYFNYNSTSTTTGAVRIVEC